MICSLCGDWAERLIVLSAGYVIAGRDERRDLADMYVTSAGGESGRLRSAIWAGLLGSRIRALRSMNSWNISEVKNMRNFQRIY